MNLEPGEEPPKPPVNHPVEGRKPNGISPTTHLDPVSPFSQPPAPPPQQPLPEKPDVARSVAPDSTLQTSLKRIDSEKPKSAMSSPTRAEPPSSQILSLVEALTTAKREIDSQGDRVKQLEVLLKRERLAREGAEERARRLLVGHSSKPGSHESGTVDGAAFERPAESKIANGNQLPNGHIVETGDQPENLNSTPAHPKTREELHRDTASIDASTTRLQDRLDLMVREMDEMKIVMESYKRRAETAEEEKKGLAEMVQQIRAEFAAAAKELGDESTILGSSSSPNSDAATSWGSSSTYATSSSDSTPATNQQDPKYLNGRAITGMPSSSATQTDHGMSELERTVSTALQEASKSQRWGRVSGGWGGSGEGAVVQGAPYASMVGVVLIGVGIMTWLNGWQRGER